jgi:hypothetical protein
VAKNINQFYPIRIARQLTHSQTPTTSRTLASEIQAMRQYTFKGDHRFSNANSVFGRYSFFNHKTDNGAGGATVYPNEVVSKRDDDLKNWNVVVSDTHVFSPTVVNEFRVGRDSRILPLRRAQLWGGLAG